MNSKLSEELKNLAQTQIFAPLTKHFNDYEKRAKKLVRELDARSREAREKGKHRFEELFSHLKETRGKIEVRMKQIVEEESKKLNKKLSTFLDSWHPTNASDSIPKRKKARSVSGAPRRAKRTATQEQHATQ